MPTRRIAGIGAALLLLTSASVASDTRLALTMEEAIAMAVAASPAAAGAAAAAAGARAAVDRVEAEGDLQVRLESRASWLSELATMQVAPGGPNVELGEHAWWSAALTASYPLWTGGRVTALSRQARAMAGAADATAGRAIQLAAFGAERAFLGLAAAQEERGVAEQVLAAAESHVKVAGARFEAGAAARFDLLRAEVQAKEAKQIVIQKEAALVVAHGALLQALGRADGDYEAIPPDDLPAAPSPLPELIATALARRPEMQAARLQIAAADAGVAVAEAERLPVVSVAADYLVAEPDSTAWYDRLAVGASVVVPVLDGGRARARRAEAREAARQAGASREALALQIGNEVRQAWSRLASARAQVDVARVRVEQAEELLRLAGVRYEGGVGTATEVADAQASLASGRFGLTRARVDLLIADAELRLALGAGRDRPAAGRE